MTLDEYPHHIQSLRDEAKALWGEDLVVVMAVHMPLQQSQQYHMPAYLHHLENMLHSDDPVRYLKDNKPEVQS